MSFSFSLLSPCADTPPTVEWRLPALHQGGGSVHAPPLALVAVVPVPAVAAVPGAAQRDVHANVEGPVT